MKYLQDNLGNFFVWMNDPARVLKMVAGIGLLFLAFILLITPETAKVATTVAKVA